MIFGRCGFVRESRSPHQDDSLPSSTEYIGRIPVRFDCRINWIRSRVPRYNRHALTQSGLVRIEHPSASCTRPQTLRNSSDSLPARFLRMSIGNFGPSLHFSIHAITRRSSQPAVRVRSRGRDPTPGFVGPHTGDDDGHHLFQSPRQCFPCSAQAGPKQLPESLAEHPACCCCTEWKRK